MPHNNHTTSNSHIELDKFGIDFFENETKNFISSYQDPYIQQIENMYIVRDDIIVGTKARLAELLISKIKEDELVYVQPRVGLAGVSILDLCAKYKKRLTLFMPACKEISYHQACCIERGANPIFRRIAAMPNLNKYAKEYAESNGACFLPFGLKHELVVAMGYKIAKNIQNNILKFKPDTVFIAVSTGVLIRGLQLGFDSSEIIGVAVARNMKDGEIGRAKIISEPKAFQQFESIENLPPYPSVNTYDAKIFKYAKKYSEENPDKKILIWNVGKEPQLNGDLKEIQKNINSNVSWDKYVS